MTIKYANLLCAFMLVDLPERLRRDPTDVLNIVAGRLGVCTNYLIQLFCFIFHVDSFFRRIRYRSFTS